MHRVSRLSLLVHRFHSLDFIRLRPFLPGGFLREESSSVSGRLQHADLRVCSARRYRLPALRSWLEARVLRQSQGAHEVASAVPSSCRGPRQFRGWGRSVISFFSPDKNAYSPFWTDRYCVVLWCWSSLVCAFV